MISLTRVAWAVAMVIAAAVVLVDDFRHEEEIRDLQVETWLANPLAYAVNGQVVVPRYRGTTENNGWANIRPALFF